jgi:two-component system, NtrC family, nitrogen regulation sensor histidine kinase NtrY
LKNVVIILGVLLVLLLLLVGVNWFIPLDGERDYAQKVSSSLAEELKRAENEAVRLRSSQPTDEFWINSSYSFFLVKDGKINAWSKNDFVPELSTIVDDFSIRFIQNNKGSFVVKKWKEKDTSFLALVLPLKFQYGIVNDYLSPSKNPILPNHCDIVSNKYMRGTCVKIGSDGCFFKLISNYRDPFLNSTKALLQLAIGVLILFVVVALVNRLIVSFVKSWRYEMLFLANLVMLISVRIGMVELNIPRIFTSDEFFDPIHYASSSFNVSIGDLLINSLVVSILCVFLFKVYRRFEIVKLLLKLNEFWSLLLSALFVFIIYLAFLFPCLYIESIYHNSAISLEITDSIYFDPFRIAAFFSLLLGCISSYLVVYIFLRLSVFGKKRSHTYFIGSFALGTIMFVLFFLVSEKDYWIALITGLIFLPTLYVVRFVNHYQKVSFSNYVYLLIIIIAFSIECSLSTFKFNQEKKTESQFKFGSGYLVDQDILAEFLLHEAAISIAKDIEIKKVIGLKNQASMIEERVTQFHLTSYLDRYQISVGCFPRDSSSLQIDKIKERLVETNKTSVENIYFVNDPSSDTLKRYITMIPMRSWNGLDNSFIVLDLCLKKIIPETVFPELMIDNRYGQNFRNKEFSYALFTSGKIGSTFGGFNYEKQFNLRWLGLVDLYTKGLVENGYRHVAIEYQPHRIAVVTTPIYPLEHVVINFSFYIALGLVFIFAFFLLGFLLSWGKKNAHLGYTSRIQLYVYFSFFIPLLIVSLVTLRLITSSAESQKEEEYLSKAKILEERIAAIVDNYKILGFEYKSQLETKLIEIAEVANLDVSVFSKEGEVIASSEPLIFKNHILSGIIDRAAWHSIVVNHENFSIQSEAIGKLLYKNVYWRVRSPISGEVIAVLSIPFFESASSLEQTQISLVSAILGVFSIAFILFSLLSYFAINQLTTPLRFVTQALTRISLSGKNEPINWKGNDELGIMAQEYNKMLLNLDDSKAQLQKNQKEIAWREVAQQVAHEIKNPLTPMKLILQQLELDMIRGEIEKEKSKKSIQRVLKQVDILNDIASSFSNFAKMPVIEITSINVTELLRNTIGLYSHQPEVRIEFNQDIAVFVRGDEAILLRAFSNIILNAIQSMRQQAPMRLQIVVIQKENECTISFHDNGTGIAEEDKGSVFRPYFTTKLTGTGLGLAIVKQTLELCNSSIWFETEVGRGTSFYLKLPLANQLSTHY